jgi:hypothetical protein
LVELDKFKDYIVDILEDRVWVKKIKKS